jgi:AcrR family transcriptional regulator
VAAILEAAERVIVKEGRKSLTTKRVARVAGVSIGSIYQFFPNKEALVVALERHTFGKVLEVFQVALATAVEKASAAGPINRLVFELVESMSRLLAERFRVHGVARFADLPEALQAERAAALETVVDVVASALAPYAAEVRPENHRLAAALVVHGVISLTELGLAYHPAAMASGEAPREIARMMTGYLVRDA